MSAMTSQVQNHGWAKTITQPIGMTKTYSNSQIAGQNSFFLEGGHLDHHNMRI